MAVEKYKLGSITTLLSTEMDSLANNALAIGSAFDNTQGQTGDGYTLCDLELVTGTTSGSVTAGTGLSLWLLRSQDGTNYEKGSFAVTPAREPDFIFPLRSTTSGQLVIMDGFIPWGKFKPLVKNDGTGQSLNATGNTIKLRTVTRELV